MFTKSKGLLFLGSIVLIGLLIGLVFFNSTSPTNLTSQAASPTPSPTATLPRPTLSQFLLNENSARPTNLPSPTLTPTLTKTPIPTPTATATPTPTTMWRKIGNAGTIDGWPTWCVKAGDNGQASVQLFPAEVENICFNEASTQILASFAIEWTVRVDSGSALLVYGQNNIFYKIIVRPAEGTLALHEVHNFVSDDWQNLGELFPLTIRTEEGAFNTVRITRFDSTTTLSLNGDHVKEFHDNLFGDHTPIKVGFGAIADENNGAVVYLKALNIYTLVK